MIMLALHSAMLAMHKAAAYILLPVVAVMAVYTLNRGFFAVYWRWIDIRKRNYFNLEFYRCLLRQAS